MNCSTCRGRVQPDSNYCPHCGTQLHPVSSRHVFRMHRETPEKVEQHLTLQQINHKHFHLDFGELFEPTPAAKVSLPGWLWVASILSILAVPFVRLWWTLGITSQILLYATYRCFTDRQKLWTMLALVFLWGVCLFLWPPTGI